MLEALKSPVLARAAYAVVWAGVGAVGTFVAAVYPSVHSAFCAGVL